MTKNQTNLLAALKQQITSKRRWLSIEMVLASYDNRAIAALHRAGLIEINTDYGVRIVKA